MKKDIHPKFHTDAKVNCACGNTFTTGSTKKAINVEICSACHPFYTGKSKLVDTAGRVDKFKAKMEKAAKMQKPKKQDTINKKANKKQDTKNKKPKN